MLALLEWFLPLESDLIPDNSLLREFIGGSIWKILSSGRILDNPGLSGSHDPPYPV